MRNETSAFDPASMEFLDEGRYDTATAALRPGLLVLIIASVPRSGSMYLCEVLRTNAFGIPHEYLNPKHMNNLMVRWNIKGDKDSTLDEYIGQVAQRRATHNNILSIKIHFHQLLRARNNLTLQNMLRRARFVYLTRRDLVRQAVSLDIAERANVWTSLKQVDYGKLDYNFNEITTALDTILMHQTRWEKFFYLNGIRPLRLSYEEFVRGGADMVEVIRRIATFIGRPAPEPCELTSRIERESDPEKAQWIERFKIDCFERGLLISDLKPRF